MPAQPAVVIVGAPDSSEEVYASRQVSSVLVRHQDVFTPVSRLSPLADENEAVPMGSPHATGATSPFSSNKPG